MELRRLVIGSVAIVSVALSGCGVSGDAGGETVASVGASSTARLARSAATTGSVDTVKVSMETEVVGVDGADGLTMTSSGAFDLANGRGELTMDLGTLPLLGDGGTIDAVVDGDSIYLSAPFLSDVVGSKPWIEVSSERIGKVTGSAADTDPLALLDYLDEAGIDVTEVGAEDVRGTETTHYTAQVDTAALLDRADGPHRDRLEEHLDELGLASEDLPTVPLEVWIDADDQVRRLTITVDGSSLANGSGRLDGASIIETLELYDFDEPVEVALPDPSEVASFDLPAFDD